MDTPKPAPAPDPVATANAQGTANKATAVAQYGLNATNQNTPTGSLSYKQIGQWDDGTPRFEATTALNPTEQGIFNTNEGTKQNLADIGNTQSARIGTLLNTPFDLSKARDDKVKGFQDEFLNPMWDREQQKLEASNIAKGIRPGSEQYFNANRDFSDQRQRGYDQAYLDTYKTGTANALAERNQPINEITALMSGSQVSNPAFQNTPSPGVAPTDVIGAQQQALNQSNVGFNAQMAQNQALMSGLFGLGGAGIKMAGMTYGGPGWGT
jgi:hypothetical protein